MNISDTAAMGAFILAYLALALVLIVVLYVFNCFGIMKLMQAKGMDNTYRAWIPSWSVYVLGTIIEEELADNSAVKENVTRWIITLAPLAAMIPSIGSFLAFAGAIYQIVVCAILASKYGTTASMIISSIFGLPAIGYIILAGKMESVEATAYSGSTNTESAKVVSYEVETDEKQSETEETVIEIDDMK